MNHTLAHQTAFHQHSIGPPRSNPPLKRCPEFTRERACEGFPTLSRTHLGLHAFLHATHHDDVVLLGIQLGLFVRQCRELGVIRGGLGPRACPASSSSSARRLPSLRRGAATTTTAASSTCSAHSAARPEGGAGRTWSCSTVVGVEASAASAASASPGRLASQRRATLVRPFCAHSAARPEGGAGRTLSRSTVVGVDASAASAASASPGRLASQRRATLVRRTATAASTCRGTHHPPHGSLSVWGFESWV